MQRRRLPLLTALLLALLAPAGAPAAVDASPPLSTGLARALAVPHVSPARTAALAVDLTTGETIFTRHATLPLLPASNEKLAVTFAALSELGPGFRIQTDVLGEGELDGSVWRGDLVLQGHGDPTLRTGGLKALAHAVKAEGITHIAGRILGDETFFDAKRMGPGWKPSFYIDESPPLSALSVDRGRYRGYITRYPAAAAASLFRDALRAAGVSVAGAAATGKASPDALPLASINSPPLDRILAYMDRESDNFTAELLLKQLGATVRVPATSAGGAAVVRHSLAAAGVPLRGVRIADGSGLSLLDRLTVGALGGMLEQAWANPDLREPFFGALPVAGINGTLSDRMERRPARGNVRAKTGTTSNASALSGYVKKRYVFAVVQNGSPISSYWARRAQDRFATVLAAY